MSYSQPTGYRMPASVSLPSVSRALERFGWPVWRVETVRALAAVAIDLLNSSDDRDTVYKRLSHGQISEVDLVISTTTERGLLHRAAEFLDVAHGIMHRPSAGTGLHAVTGDRDLSGGCGRRPARGFRVGPRMGRTVRRLAADAGSVQPFLAAVDLGSRTADHFRHRGVTSVWRPGRRVRCGRKSDHHSGDRGDAPPTRRQLR